MIIFDNVSKVYPNGVVGLKDIDLTIEDGEFVSIIGLSGAGRALCCAVSIAWQKPPKEIFALMEPLLQKRIKRAATDSPPDWSNLAKLQSGKA